MKKNDKKQLNNNFIEQKIAEAFGYTDEQLAEELDRFVEEAEKSDEKALEAPEGEFQKIWNRVEWEHRSQQRKGSRVKRLAKGMAVAAILGTMVFSGGMWVGAKRRYAYETEKRGDVDNIIVLNDSLDDYLITDDFWEEKKAYEQIKDELNINVLELSYLPDDVKFYTIMLERNKGKMMFLDSTNTPLYFYQGRDDKPSSLSYASDMRQYDSVYNKFLEEEIVIYENEVENGKEEFSVRIIKEHQYYILQGSIDKDEFIQIVEGIKVYGDSN